MKLSEKTLELNICAQISAYLPNSKNIFWFGLTQQQEAKAGFDACTKLGGRLLIFQFKASNHVLKKCGRRKFLAPHYQLTALKRLTGSCQRSVFYALPLVGNTLDIKRKPDLLSQTWLLDVASLSHLGHPTKSDGSIRKNGCHNMYVKPGMVEIHSDPVHEKLINAADFFRDGLRGSDGVESEFNNNFGLFWESRHMFSKGARAAVVFSSNNQINKVA